MLVGKFYSQPEPFRESSEEQQRKKSRESGHLIISYLQHICEKRLAAPFVIPNEGDNTPSPSPPPPLPPPPIVIMHAEERAGKKE
jgi:hypothetical protein